MLGGNARADLLAQHPCDTSAGVDLLHDYQNKNSAWRQAVHTRHCKISS